MVGRLPGLSPLARTIVAVWAAVLVIGRLVADPDRPADVRFDLVAREQNGTSPGPELRVRQGQLVEVRVHNASVADGTTLP
jgi:hypothetical protein